MVTILDKTGGMSRRQLLKTGAASAVLMVTGTAVICPEQAWGLEASALKPTRSRRCPDGAGHLSA